MRNRKLNFCCKFNRNLIYFHFFIIVNFAKIFSNLIVLDQTNDYLNAEGIGNMYEATTKAFQLLGGKSGRILLANAQVHYLTSKIDEMPNNEKFFADVPKLATSKIFQENKNFISLVNKNDYESSNRSLYSPRALKRDAMNPTGTNDIVNTASENVITNDNSDSKNIWDDNNDEFSSDTVTNKGVTSYTIDENEKGVNDSNRDHLENENNTEQNTFETNINKGINNIEADSRNNEGEIITPSSDFEKENAGNLIENGSEQQNIVPKHISTEDVSDKELNSGHNKKESSLDIIAIGNETGEENAQNVAYATIKERKIISPENNETKVSSIVEITNKSVAGTNGISKTTDRGEAVNMWQAEKSKQGKSVPVRNKTISSFIEEQIADRTKMLTKESKAAIRKVGSSEFSRSNTGLFLDFTKGGKKSTSYIQKYKNQENKLENNKLLPKGFNSHDDVKILKKLYESLPSLSSLQKADFINESIISKEHKHGDTESEEKSIEDHKSGEVMTNEDTVSIKEEEEKKKEPDMLLSVQHLKNLTVHGKQFLNFVHDTEQGLKTIKNVTKMISFLRSRIATDVNALNNTSIEEYENAKRLINLEDKQSHILSGQLSYLKPLEVTVVHIDEKHKPLINETSEGKNEATDKVTAYSFAYCSYGLFNRGYDYQFHYGHGNAFYNLYYLAKHTFWLMCLFCTYSNGTFLLVFLTILFPTLGLL